MAREDDVETQTQPGHTETTPLLAGEQPEQSPPTQQATDKISIRWVLWRIVWAVVAALGLVVFVKGWIDADGDANFNLHDALRKALGGGLSGAAAMVLQVLLLMPLRTIMNYQYRFGASFSQATQILYADGGFGRYYAGIGAALIQGPVARFGDTAANAGILALLQSNSYLKHLPSLGKTVFASLCAAGFRMILTPVDTLKTTLQTHGSNGTALLRKRIREHGIGTLWWGAFATAGATFVGHYPWFATYNLLTEAIQEPPKTELFLWLLRLAFIGFVASIISDSVSNSLRVIKTYRQVNDTKVSYGEAVRLVVRDDGVSGLLGRGLTTRILSNGLQGLLFSILWKLFLDIWEQRTKS
ncbi:mitochondrial carrier [Trichoderma novae-zelandiae]